MILLVCLTLAMATAPAPQVVHQPRTPVRTALKVLLRPWHKPCPCAVPPKVMPGPGHFAPCVGDKCPPTTPKK